MIIQKGGTLSFRLPSDLPDEILTYLNKQKQAYGRRWSSILASKLLQTIENEMQQQEQQIITLKLSSLSQIEQTWLNNPKNQEMLIKFFMQAYQKTGKETVNSTQHLQAVQNSEVTVAKTNTINIETHDFIMSQILK